MGIFLGTFDDFKTKVQKEMLQSVSAGHYEDKKKQYESDVEKKLKEIEDVKNYKLLKSNYKVSKNQIITQIAQVIFDNWKKELIEKSKLRKKNPPPTEEEWKKFKEDTKKNNANGVENAYKSSGASVVSAYVTQVKKIYPKKKISEKNEKQSILNSANSIARKSIRVIVKQVKDSLKQFSIEFDVNEQLNKIQEQIANIPLKIEEKIDQIQDILDMLMGKAFAKTNPDKPDFDIKVLIAQLNTMLNPIVSGISPLQTLGKFPVIGELAGLIGMMSSASSPSKLSQQELDDFVQKQLNGKLPQLDMQFLNKCESVGKDMMMVMTTIPVMLINVILSMINTIYSKLEIITSVIPLGNMFPLNLLPSAIKLVTMLPTFIMCFPVMMRQTVMALIRQKLAEMQALAFPTIGTGDFPLLPLIEEHSDNEPKKTEEQKKETFKSVTEDFYNLMKRYNYTKYQINDILKNYCQINDGSNAQLDGFMDDEKGLKHYSVIRGAQNINEYKALLESISGNAKDKIEYDSFYETQKIAGMFFDEFKTELLAKYGECVVLKKTIKPANVIFKM